MGAYISMFLVGITTLQAWNYFRVFSGDPRAVKAIAGVVYTADLYHSIALVYTVHYYTFAGFNCVHPYIIIDVVWSLDSALIVEAFIILIVQCYFGLRVMRITERVHLAAGIWILAVVRMALTISVAATARRDGTVAIVYSSSIKVQNSLALGIGAATDILTAAALCTALLRRRTGFGRTDKVIDRFVAFTVGSGLLTSIITVTQLITYLTMTGNFVWTAFFSIGAKIFSNSLLASLNQRATVNSSGGALFRTGRESAGLTEASTRVTFQHVTQAEPIRPDSSISLNTLANRGDKGALPL